MSTISENETFERDYDRGMFRSAVFSTLWAAFGDRKRQGFNLSQLAARLGKDKGYVSRLFSSQENCKLNTISDVARALDAEVRFELFDRKTGVVCGPAGVALARQVRSPVISRTIVMSDEPESGIVISSGRRS